MTDLDALRPGMTMALDDVPTKLNELDLCAPREVFDAIYAAIRERADLWSKWQRERCFRAKAEAELAALKARIAEAPTATLMLTSGAGDLTLVWAENPDDWAGKRVRPVVEE